MCFSLFPPEKGKHINNLTPTHFRDNPAKLFMFIGFFPPTPRGSCNNTLLRRVLRRFSNSKCFLEGFLEGTCKGFQQRQGS